MKNPTKILGIISLVFSCNLLLISCGSSIKELSVKSPDNAIQLNINLDSSGQLVYSLYQNKIPIIESSLLGITVDDIDLGKEISLGNPKSRKFDETYKTRGVHSEARNHYNDLVIPVQHNQSNTLYNLEIRAFDDGVAYRYVLPGKGTRKIVKESGSWKLPSNTIVWHHNKSVSYEGMHQKSELQNIEKGRIAVLPLVSYLPDQECHVAISEGALLNYSGMTLKADGKNGFHVVFEDDPEGWELHDTITTPWRITMLSKDLNGLVNNDIVSNVCQPPLHDLVDADWIKPGRCLWSWWPDSTGDWNVQKEYIDYAVEMGFEAILIDEGWRDWNSGDKDGWALLKEVVDYGKEKQIKVWVWNHWNEIKENSIRRTFFKRLNELGVIGVKIDFMDSESKERIDFYTNCLREAAEHKLMINFHGANKPTGESRTWPNEMTREGVRGLEYNRFSKVTPNHNATIPFTRFIVGHGDYTPCTFTRDRLMGTTFAHQLATAIVYTSSVTNWADKPNKYIESIAIDIIKSVPTTWDETKVLHPSEIGELAAFARRKGDLWFVGMLNGGKEKEIKIDLDFLGDRNYNATILSDKQETPLGFLRTEKRVNSEESLVAKMNEGGGFVVRLEKTDQTLKKLEMIPQGGFLTDAVNVEIKTEDSDAEIRYTLDGSIPTSESRLYISPVPITEATVLTAATFKGGNRENLLVTGNFMTPPPPTIIRSCLFIDEIDIEISNEIPNEKIYYTLDGKEPGLQSQLYTNPVKIKNSMVLKAKAFWESGYSSLLAVSVIST